MGRAAWRPGALAILSVACAAGAACGGGSRDVVPESQDKVVGQGTHDRAGAYEYVARRPLAVVAMAEARGIAGDVARAAIDHLADTLDACVTDRARGGGAPARLPNGAARVVAQLDAEGRVAAATLRVEPLPGVAELAALCLVAPVRGLTFPPADAGARGFAIEALWGNLPPPAP